VKLRALSGVDALASGLLVLSAAPILFRQLGGASLGGDETIFAEVGREAATRGTWLPLRFGGTLFQGKPPAFPWVLGLTFKALGVSEWTARLPAALSGVALVLLVYLAGAALFSRRAGCLAATVLLTNFNLIFTHGLRKGVTDGPLLLVMSAALFLYLCQRTEPEPESGPCGRPRVGIVLACGLLLGVGLLIKTGVAVLGVGIVGLFVLLFPLPGEGGLLSPRRWRDPLLLLAGALAVYLPWLLAMGVATHGTYFHYLFGVDLYQRVTEGIDAGHVRHGVYPRVLLVDFRTKLLLLLAVPVLLAWRRRADGAESRGELARVTFLALWVAVVIGGFSVPVSKLPWYIYPAYPALALLLGWSLDGLYRLLPRPSWRPRGLLAPLFLALVAVVLARGLWRSFEAAGEDVAESDGARIAAYVHRQGPSLTCVEPGTVMREWNYFYLSPLWGRFVHGPADAPGCDFILTRDPRAYLAASPPEEPARRAFQIRHYDPHEGPVWFLSLRRDLSSEILAAPAPRPEASE
jgi:4-amino-4-deoxy-L-arabinose transferase-like glycosyltransferase